ncbi:MAG TPA: hypothetical protein DCS93_09565 [Microscillaceae bacterium]|nr:hypothetical protein [Microscillaceae bacterium]
MKYYTYIIYLGLFLSCTKLLAQSPYLQQITDREGLPSMVVYDIMEDRQGYIWLGTEAGICRYDGVHFQTFKVPSARGKSFTTLQEDRQGRVYFVNFSKQLFYLHQGKAKTVLLPRQLQETGIDSYCIDGHNYLWVSGNQGAVFRKDPQTQQWKQIKTHGSVSVYGVQLFLDKQGEVWLLYLKVLVQLNEQLKVTRKIQIPFLLMNLIFTEKEIIAHNERTFYSYSLAKESRWKKLLQQVKEPSTALILLAEDHQQNIWTCTYNGAKPYVYSQKSSIDQFIFLENKFVSDMIQDREENYWFTTLGHGLFKMPNKDIVHFNARNSNLEFEQINCLAQDPKGNIFIGTNGDQLYYFDTKEQKITEKHHLMSGGDVECLLVDSVHRKLYVENHQVLVFDLQNMKQTDKYWMGSTPKSLGIYQNKYLIAASGDQAFIGHLERNTERPQPWDILPDIPYDSIRKIKRLRRKRSRVALAESAKSRFWIGYADGLYFYENDTEQELKTPDQQPIIALGMSEDAEGIIWVGTAQQGVFAIKNERVIQHLHPNNGLISEFCRRVIKEGNLLYLGTDKGLQVYDLQTKQSRVFNQADGLPSNEIRDLIVQKHKIYLATAAGLSVLNKDFNTTNYTPPLIYITGLSVQNQPQQLQKRYELAYHKNNLSIRFTGIAFRSNGKFRYKYRMKGLDKQWTYNNGTNNLARYSALPSGKYQFEVKAINEDGIESKKTASIEVIIAYPVWEKWWFITLMVLLALASMGAIIFFRLRAYRRKSRLEKALNKAALESLKLQMNPHFIFNAMGAIQNYMITNDTRHSSIYLAKFSKLMRAVLENSRQEYINLDEEIEMLEDYLSLQNLRFEEGFEYRITVDEQLDTEFVAIPPMFAQPFIENAIEHGITHLKGNGLIQVNFSLQEKVVILKITDNGIGIENSLETKQTQKKAHRSLATTITQERIDLYRQSLKKNITFEVKSLAQGTQVIFHLPYQQL